MIKKILCPSDFSAASHKACDYAQQFAEENGAQLLLVHAFDIPQTMNLAGQTHPADPQVRDQLESIPLASAVQCERILHAGPPGEVICWLAQDRQCDLIIMGTHGHTRLMHLLVGSVTEFVLRHARCPVLIVRDRPADEPPLHEPRVLPLKAPRFM